MRPSAIETGGARSQSAALLSPLLETSKGAPRGFPRSEGVRSIPLEDELFMSPWHKWAVYRRLPLKMVVHLLLIAVATPTILIAEYQKVSFLHDLRVELVRLYYPARCRPECLQGGGEGSRYCQLPPQCAFAVLDDVKSFVGGVVDGYYSAQQRLVPRISYLPDRKEPALPEAVHMRVHWMRPRHQGELLTGVSHYDLRQDGTRLGPLEGIPSLNVSERSVFDRMASLEIRIHFKSIEYDELYGGKRRLLNVLYPSGPIVWSFVLRLEPTAGRQLLELGAELHVEIDEDPVISPAQLVCNLAFCSWLAIALLSMLCMVLALRSVALTLVRTRWLDQAAAAEAAAEAHGGGGELLSSAPPSPSRSSVGFGSPASSELARPLSLAAVGRSRTEDSSEAARALLTKVAGGSHPRTQLHRLQSCSRLSLRELERSSAAAAEHDEHGAAGQPSGAATAANGGSAAAHSAAAAAGGGCGGTGAGSGEHDGDWVSAGIDGGASRPAMIAAEPAAGSCESHPLAPSTPATDSAVRLPPPPWTSPRSTASPSTPTAAAASLFAWLPMSGQWAQPLTRSASGAADVRPAAAARLLPACARPCAAAGGCGGAGGGCGSSSHAHAHGQACRHEAEARRFRRASRRSRADDEGSGPRNASASAWRELGFCERLFTLLSAHTLVLVFGCGCLVHAAVLRLRVQLRIDPSIDLVDRGWPSLATALGIGCLWLSLTRYFEWVPALYTFTHTLRRAGKSSLTLMAAVLPVFLAYALAGTVLFSDSTGNFSGFSASCVTLWAMCVGDEVNEDFRQVYEARPIVGRLYTYSFTAIFYFICANIFVFLIEAAHYAALRDILAASGSPWAHRLLTRAGMDGAADDAPISSTAPHGELEHHRLAEQAGSLADFRAPPRSENAAEAIARIELVVLAQQRMLVELLQAQRGGLGGSTSPPRAVPRPARSRD